MPAEAERAPAAGIGTGTVLIVNSPYAEGAVGAWNRAGRFIEIGWHPNLTHDRPILPPERVPASVEDLNTQSTNAEGVQPQSPGSRYSAHPGKRK